jgi:hypothetical protein
VKKYFTMEKLKFSFFIILILSCFETKAQVSADSLPGTYQGIYRTKKSIDSTWTIYPITVYVDSVDSASCQILSIQTSCCVSYGYPWPFYTGYAYCTIPPSNHYFLFYGGDSLRIISNNVPQPPPITYSVSYQTYVKRINDGISGISAANLSEAVEFFPNPANDKIYFLLDSEKHKNIEFCLFDVFGIKLTSWKSKNTEPAEMDISGLNNGIYFLHIMNEKEMSIKRIVIQH